MAKTTLEPPLAIGSLLFGLGLFSVLYPAIVLFFAPTRVLAPHHLYFLIAGLVLLSAAGICFWIGRSRLKAQ
jgi:hypothetical protein